MIEIFFTITMIVFVVILLKFVYEIRICPSEITSKELIEWEKKGEYLNCLGYNIFVITDGNNQEFVKAEDTLVLFHGFPESNHVYKELIERLRGDFGFIVAFDFKGFGFSDKPVAKTFEDYSITL